MGGGLSQANILLVTLESILFHVRGTRYSDAAKNEMMIVI